MSDNNEIVIELKGVVDTEDAQTQLSTLRQNVSAAKEEVFKMRDAFSEMPHFGQLLNNSLERTGVVADNAIKKLDALAGGNFSSQQEQDNLISRAHSSLRDFDVQRSMYNENSFFNVNSARAWAKKLDKTVQQELDGLTPKLTQIIRSKISAIAKAGYNFQFSDIIGMTSEITNNIRGARDRKTASVIGNVKHASSDDLNSYISYLVANTVAPMYVDEYSLRRYGSRASNNRLQFGANPENIIPDGFKASWRNKKHQRASGYSKTGFVLNAAATNLLNDVFASSPAAVRAGLNSGLLSRASNGMLQRTHLIDEKMLEDFYESMYVDAIQKTKGLGVNRIENIYSADVATKIAKRMSSGNTGRTWEALGRLGELRSEKYWTDRSNIYDRTPLQISSEARPELQMYSTKKYAPFSIIAGRKDRPEFSSISESQNTRKLGLQNRGNYADVSDVVSLLSLEGYDENNKEHVSQLQNILKKGYKVGKTRMMVQSIHRGNDGIVARLVSQKAMQEVDEAERSFAEGLGFQGSYWKGYQDEVINQLAKDGKLSKVIFGKYQDSLNKAWSPSAQLGLNFDGKRIAIIDTESNGRDVADGIGFISENILPYSIQSRGALGHKGTIRRLPGESLRSFAIRSGAARWNPNKQAANGTMGDYEWMQRGLGGDMFDIIDYHGFVSASTIKDKNAYTNADGTKMSSEKSSQVFTERLKRDGLGAVTIFDEDGTASDNVGVQMMSFMKLSPELVNNQLSGLIQRMRELDTEEGQLKYVFSDPSSSWVSRAVNNGEEGRALLQTEQAKSQVDAYRNSLIKKAMSGIFVDYGNNEADSITNVEIADSPLSIFARMGQVNGETKKYLRNALKEQLGKEYSDSEFEDLLQLRGMNVIDFGKLDEDTLAYLRSPTGYGNMVVANNRAKEYKVMYDALGKRQIDGFSDMSFFADKGGVALSSEIMGILQGADEDGDKVKRLTGLYKDMVARTVETVKTVSETDADIGFIPDETPISEKDLKNKTAHMALVSNLKKESDSMGGGSAAARGAQLDLSKSGNYDYVKGAIQGQNIYNLLGTQGKKPGSATNTAHAINAMKLGKEFTKFTEGFNKVLALDQDMYDENKKIIVDHPDVFFDEETGLAINMRALKNLDTQHINLPSVNMDNVLMANTLSRGLNENGLLETNQVDAIGRAMDAMYQYNPDRLAGAGENTVKVAKIMDLLRIQHAKGERFALEEDEENSLRALYVAAKSEIDKEADSREIRGRGSVLLDDGTTMGRKAYITKKMKEYGLNIADNYLNSFGFTRRNLAIKFGKDAFNDVQNDANATLPLEIPVDKTQEPVKPKKVFKSAKKRSVATEQVIETVEEEDTPKPAKAKEIRGIKRYKIKDGDLHSEIVCPEGVFDGNNAIMEYNPELPLISQLQILQDANAQRAAIDNFLERSGGYRSSFNKEIFRDKERTDADNFYGRATYFRNLTDSDAEALLATIHDPATIEMIKGTRADVQSGYIDATSQWSKNYNTAQLEALKKAASGVGDEFAAQESKLQSFNKRIENINSNIKNFISSRDALGGLNEEENKQVDEMRRQKDEAEQYRVQAIQKLKNETGESYFNRLYSIQETVIGKALSPAERVDLQINKNRRNIEGTLDGLKNLSTDEIEKYFNRYEYDEIIRNYEAALNIVNSDAYRNQLLKKNRYQVRSADTRERMQSLQRDQYVKQLERSSEIDALRDNLYKTGLGNTAIGQSILRNRERYNYYASKHDNAQQRISEENAYIDNQRNARKTATSDAERALATKNIQEASHRLREYYKELDRAKAGMDKFSGATGTMRIGLVAVNQAMNRFVAQFGRRFFYKLIQEVKRSVLEYDAAMTEIQTITMATNAEMDEIGANFIDKAINLKTSVSNVTSVETELHRQGLDDAEVESRTENIIKFAKVAQIKTTEATKIITTALQNNLVGSAEDAMDALTALGDSAATTASEIAKGMQRSAASAKVAGVSYAELTAMLTIGTSMTQLGGAQIGTAYKTIFSRMRALTSTEYAADQSGEVTSVNEAEAALNTAGIALREENGTFRSTFDILLDISKVWEDLGDIQKSVITNAIAGSRQANIFQTLMEGMSEDGGKQLEEYLGLASGSEGITQTKYEIAINSIASSFDTLKSSFDGLIATAESAGIITGFLGSVSSFFQGLSGYTGETEQNVAAITTLVTAIASLIALFTLGPAGAGIIAGAGIFGIGSLLKGFSKKQAPDSNKINTSIIEASSSDISSLAELKSNIEDLDNRYQKLSSSEQEAALSQDEYTSAIKKALHGYESLNRYIDSSTGNINNWNDAVKASMERIDELEAQSRNRVYVNSMHNFAENYSEAAEEYRAATSAYDVDPSTTFFVEANTEAKKAFDTFVQTNSNLLSEGSIDANYDVSRLSAEAREVLFGTQDVDKIYKDNLVRVLLSENYKDGKLPKDYSEADLQKRLQYVVEDNGQTLTIGAADLILRDLGDNDPGYKYSISKAVEDMYSDYLVVGTPEYDKMMELGLSSFNKAGDDNSFVSRYNAGNAPEEAFLWFTDLYGTIIGNAPSSDVQRILDENAVDAAIDSIEGFDDMLLSSDFSDEERTAVHDKLRDMLLNEAESFRISNGSSGIDLSSESSVKKYIEDILAEWVDIRNEEGSLDGILDDSSFQYYVDLNDGSRKRFHTKTDAETFVQDSKGLYGLDAIRNAAGDRVFTNSGDLIASAIKYRSESNAYLRETDDYIDQMLGITSMSDIDEEYNQYLSKILSRVPELAGLYELVDRTDKGTLSAGEQGMSLGQLQSVLPYFKTGATVDNEFFDVYAADLLKTQEGAYDLMTNPVLASYYEKLTSLYGDPFTKFVTGIASGDLSTKDNIAFNKAYKIQSVKDLGLSDQVTKMAIGMIESMFGDPSQQMSQYASSIGEMDKMRQMGYYLDSLEKGNMDTNYVSALSSYLDMSQETFLREWNSEDGRKRIEKMLSVKQQDFTDSLEVFIETVLGDGFAFSDVNLDTSSIVNELENEVPNILLAILQAAEAELVDGEWNFNFGGSDSSKSFNDIMSLSYNKAKKDTMGTSFFQAMLKATDEASEHVDSPPVWYASSVRSAFESQFPELQNEALENFMAQNPNMSIMWNALVNGKTTPDKFRKYLTRNTVYGMEPSSQMRSYDIAQYLGDDWLNKDYSEEDWNAIYDSYMSDSMSDDPYDRMRVEAFSEAMDGTGLDQIILKYRELDNGAQSADAGLKELRKNFNSDALAEQKGYLTNLSKVDRLITKLASNGKKAASAYSELHNEINNARNFKDALSQYKSGNRSSEVLNMLQNNSEYSADDLKRFKPGTLDYEVAIGNLDLTYDGAIAELEEILNNAFMPEIIDAVNAFNKNFPDDLKIDIGDVWVKSGYNLSSFVDMLQELGVDISNNVATLAKQLSGVGIGLDGVFDAATGMIVFNTNASGLKGSSSYRSGGSGGSKKTAGDKLIERLGHGQSLYEHQVKMVQYEQTKYENADELRNYGKMLEEEIKIEKAYLPVLESNIKALRAELSEVEEGSEDWYKLRDAILDAEEQYADINNTIDENEKKLEENHQAILKLHTDLEEMVVGEIELRIEAEKEMLAGAVSMQDIILDAVKQRYQDEWDLIKEDIEKKKEALQREKDLIDERLDARREAEDEAAKYEELAELKKQLALVSMDPTRTKDAASLRESIAELEKEIGWSIAEKEAENEKNAVQDQIDAYDEYVSQGDEDLEELLSDANNFAEEVNGVLQLSQTELFEWLKQNVKEYAESLDDAQKQMVQSWESTYKQMLGITTTYWDEVNAILSAKDTFLEYMKQSEEYIYASDDEREQLLYQWSDAYDKWRLSHKNNADYNHSDSGLGDWSGSEYTGSSSSSGGSSGSSSSSSSDTNSSGKWYVYIDGRPVAHYVYTNKEDAKRKADELRNTGHYEDVSYGQLASSIGNSSGASSSSSGLPETGWHSNMTQYGHGWYFKITENGINKYIDTTPRGSRELAAAEAKKKLKSGQKYQTKYFLRGGIADFTGPAWLDGTPSEPERILSADQTRDFETLVSIMDDFRNSGISMDVLRSMAKWSTSINIPSSLSHIGNAAYQGNSANIGDIFVNITEAQISDDRDIEELANIVGQKFVKEIGKQGFNVSRYNF